MTKLKKLQEIAFICLLVLPFLLCSQALAGSIVINNPPQPQPKKQNEVVQSGSMAVEPSEADLQLSSAVRNWLDSQQGLENLNFSYESDSQTETVSLYWQEGDSVQSITMPLEELLEQRH